MAARRRFGSIRRRESGRYQVRYPGPDGQQRTAPETFARKSEAERYLTLIEGQILRGEWIDPERGKVTLTDYAARWIVERPNLRPRTIGLYSGLLTRHITPYIGGIPIGKLTTPIIREWRTKLLESGVSVGTTAKAYRLLRAVLMTAVREDELIRTNPCRIPGADQENAPERPVLTVSQVFALAEKLGGRYRALVLVTTFASLRWGEVAALQRRDLDTDDGIVHIRQSLVEIGGQGVVLGPPKSRAGVRTVSLPAVILPWLRIHLAEYVADDPAAFVFTGPKGGFLRRGNFRKLVGWSDAVAAIGMPNLHFHDLRHTGNTLASRTGASLRDLMTRMGHDSPRAALIYQHASTEADAAIADALSAVLAAQQGSVPPPAPRPDDTPEDGAAGALVPA
ncbi:site-specific recombinase XerD [Frankia casuarinae]|jgi:integrase|uniref:Phage integrase n=1 Tax=Frankia casuarinae (strain DSM 45818 / CECT 9043 / HFP020203 / CcI3) TaxID=106370 RepID=Q2JDR1_FRACC|nr:tyrosine-type recombinase/integrase [Frankia casuarinae]ABD10581.1 phage integrase [Frankia casuarinae]EYT89696.1 site-specific recombinase XerD [Frankia casuarinae]